MCRPMSGYAAIINDAVKLWTPDAGEGSSPTLSSPALVAEYPHDEFGGGFVAVEQGDEA